LNDSKRQLFVSCVNSTVHGILIPLGVFVSLNSCGIWGDFLDESCTMLEPWFALTTAYFLADMVLLSIWPDEENQTLFLVHHTVGVLPYLINCFWCSNMHFLVGAGILIEAANPCLNLCIVLEFYGLENSDYGAWGKYATWALWGGLRCALPTYLMHGMTTIAIPAKGFSQCGVIPSYITGLLVTLFCFGVFIVKLTPEALWYLQGKHKQHKKKSKKQA
jgi:hypothetical protein